MTDTASQEPTLEQEAVNTPGPVNVQTPARVRYKDMTPEQKKQNLRERQARFRARHPERIKSYKNPEKYPLEPLPPKEKKPQKVRSAKEKPYTEEEKEARRVYMAEYRNRIQNVLHQSPTEAPGAILEVA